MSRLQVSTNFGGERLQTQARPVAQTEVAQRPVEDTRWKALANAFDAGAGFLEDRQKAQNEEDEAAARRWAQSMTVGELGKAIKEGKMLPSQSPVFVATAQHIWGVNAHEAGVREISSKLTTGELKFDKPAEIDSYLTEWRNTALSGQSKYAVAGFDKTYQQTREKFMAGVVQAKDKEWIDQAQAQATDYLANTLNNVTSDTFKGTPKDAADELMKQYQLLRHTMTMPEGARKGALGDMVTRMAATGRTELLTAFLNTEMEGIGSVRGFLGETAAQTLIHQATNSFDQAQRQRIDDETLPWYKAADAGTLNVEKLEAWAADPVNKKYVSSATVHGLTRANEAAIARQRRELQAAQIQGAIDASEYEARRRVDTAVLQGRLWEVQGTHTPRVLTKTGDTKDFDVKGYAAQSLAEHTRSMPFQQQVSVWSQNGLDNPNWKHELSAGFLNLATIGMDSKGKPTGQLNEAGKKAIGLFQELDTVNADYARGLVGEETYKRFSDIGFLMHLGRTADDAAGIASAASSGAVTDSDVDRLAKKVKAHIGDLVDNPWYLPSWVSNSWAWVTDDNTRANTAQLRGTLRRYATLLAYSGQYGTADAAIKAAGDYLSDDKVSVKINGTRYLWSELPTAPPTMKPEKWFARYLDEGPKTYAKALGFDGDEVRLEFDPNIRAYRGFIAELPMTAPNGDLFVVRKNDIQAWYQTQADIDAAKAATIGAKRVQSRKDTLAFGERVSEWAKTKGASTPSAAPPKPDPYLGAIADHLTKPPRELPAIDFSGIKNADPNARPGGFVPE